MIKDNYYSYVNKYVKILDIKGNLIASGLVISEKPNLDIPYISFDDKWFYGKNSNKVCFIECDYIDNYIPDIPPSFLIWDYWRKQEELLTSVDVYRDFSYDEIDPPIKPYIDRLNKITPNIQTVTSCCGHGRHSWWIGIQFRSMPVLYTCLTVLNSFDGKLQLLSRNSIFQYENTATFLLNPCDIEDNTIVDANFELLDKFIKRLDKEINLKII